MLPHIIITSNKDISHHFQDRFNERVSCDSIESFAIAVNHGNVFITDYYESETYNTVSTHCIYESTLGELFIAIHCDTVWTTIMPLKYHLENIDKLGNIHIKNDFMAKLEQYHLTRELS